MKRLMRGQNVPSDTKFIFTIMPIPRELIFLIILRQFCRLNIFRKEGLFQGITREIRSFSKTIVSEKVFVRNDFVSEGIVRFFGGGTYCGGRAPKPGSRIVILVVWYRPISGEKNGRNMDFGPTGEMGGKWPKKVA